MENLKSHFGRPVSGDMFWPREIPVNQALRALRNGGSVSLFGPRRTGKSSIMEEVARILSDEGYCCIDLDLEGRAGPGSFISNLIAAVPKSLKDNILTSWMHLGDIPDSLLRMFGNVKNANGEFAVDEASEKLFRSYWETISDKFLEQVQKSDVRVVLFLDELPFFCYDQIERGVDPNFIGAFLATLRRWRQAKNGVAMAVSGSIGMRHLLRKHNIDSDHLNDLTEIHLSSPDRHDAGAMLDALAKGEGLTEWTAELRDAVLDECADFMPSYLQKAFEAIVITKTSAPKDVPLAFDEHVRPSFERSFFEQFEKRLRRYGPNNSAERETAIAMMRVVHQAEGSGADRDDVISQAIEKGLSADAAEDLIYELADDGFLRDSPERGETRFAMPLVRAWYARRFSRRR